MIVAAHQPHYLPWLGYLDKLAKADLFVVMDDLQYEAQNFQNRNRVKLNHGAAWLTVPLERGAQTDRICDKRIDNARQRASSTGSAALADARDPLPARAVLRALRRRAATTSTRGRGRACVELDLHMLELARDVARHHARRSCARRRSASPGQKTDRIDRPVPARSARAAISRAAAARRATSTSSAMGRAGIGVIWQQLRASALPAALPRARLRLAPRLPRSAVQLRPERAATCLFDRSRPARRVEAA